MIATIVRVAVDRRADSERHESVRQDVGLTSSGFSAC